MNNKSTFLLCFLIVFFSACSIQNGVVIDKCINTSHTIYASGVYSQVPRKHIVVIEGETKRNNSKAVRVVVSTERFDQIEIGDTLYVKN
jgi:hypothetical protein